MKHHDPQWLLDLLDGLQFIPDSVYRAYVLEHAELKPSSDSKVDKLSWNGYSQDSRLLMDAVNHLETISAQISAIGGGKYHPEYINPPNTIVDEGKHVKATPGMKPDEMLNMFKKALIVNK